MNELCQTICNGSKYSHWVLELAETMNGENAKWVTERNWKGLHQRLFMSNVLHAHFTKRSNSFFFCTIFAFVELNNGIYVDFYGQKFIYEAVNSSCYHVINHILLPLCINFCFQNSRKKNAKSYIVLLVLIDCKNVNGSTVLVACEE